MNTKTSKLIIFISLIMVVSLVLAGCSSKATTEVPVATKAPAATEAVATTIPCSIAIPWNAHANYTMTTMHNAAIAEVEALGCTALDSVAGGNVTQHVANIEIATQQKVNGMIVGDANWADIKGAVDSAIAAGIPVVSCDLGADTTFADVTSDNAGIGKMMALALVKSIGETGTVAVIYEAGYTPVDIRMDGFYAEMKNHAGITLLGPYPAGYPNQVPEAKTQTEALLQQYAAGTLDAIVASYDSQGVGAAQAITEAGRTDIVIVGADGDQEAIQSILDGGPFVFTVAQDMAAMGMKAADIIVGKIRGETVESGTVYVPALGVDSTNAAQILSDRYGK